MNNFCKSIQIFILSWVSIVSYAQKLPGNPQSQLEEDSYRSGCIPSRAQTDLAINNVRARLRAGGDMWWDGSQPQYVVPNVDPASGEPEIVSLYSGAIWLGDSIGI